MDILTGNLFTRYVKGVVVAFCVETFGAFWHVCEIVCDFFAIFIIS